MFIKIILLIALTAYSVGVYADEITDNAVKNSKRFLIVKPEIAKWARSEKILVDAWERTLGLSVLVWLKHDGALPNKQALALNRRLANLRLLPIGMKFSENGQHLSAMIKLFAEYAQMNLSGRVKYGVFLPVDEYVKSYGKGLAEQIRGNKYLENKCKWGDERCRPPKDYWEQ